MADGAYKEIKASLIRIEDKLGVHGEKLSAIDQHLRDLNSKTFKNCSDIDNLYKLNNERENFQERLIGSFNAYKYIGVLLGVLASAISLYSFFIKP